MSSTPLYWSMDGVIDSLVAGLKTREGLEGVQVDDQWPGDEQQDESIWVGDVNCTEMNNGMRGGAPVVANEVYTIQLWVDVNTPGQRTPRDRLTELVGEVLAFVAENPRINTAEGKSNSARTAGWKYAPYVRPGGRGAACRVDITVSGNRR